MSRRILTITSVNEFASDDSWEEYKQVMTQGLGSFVNFKKLEQNGSWLISTENYGEVAESRYELKKESSLDSFKMQYEDTEKPLPKLKYRHRVKNT